MGIWRGEREWERGEKNSGFHHRGTEGTEIHLEFFFLGAPLRSRWLGGEIGREWLLFLLGGGICFRCILRGTRGFFRAEQREEDDVADGARVGQ